MTSEIKDPQAHLFSKIAKVMGEVKRIPKSGYNAHFKYNFATEGDISDMIRDLLADNNVALLSSLVSWEQTPSGNTLKTICNFAFTLACGDTGATYTCTWTAEANDGQDKGFNKAATAALKYWLLKTFMIPTGDDPDADHTEEPKQKKSAPTPFGGGKAATTPPPAQNAPNANLSANSGKVEWNSEAWNAVKAYCEKKGTSPKLALGIERGGQWTQGYDAAIAAVDAYVGVDFDAMPKASGQ